MKYGSSLALADLGPDRREPQRRQPRLEVVEGAGLDARARAGVTPVLLAKLKFGIVAVLILLFAGILRIGLTTTTVESLRAGNALRTDIQEAQSLSRQLVIESSYLSSNDRINRIVSDNPGLVFSGKGEVLDIQSDATPEGAADTTMGATTTVQ